MMCSRHGRVYVIAEAGVNHNGDLVLAKEMIHVAKDVGADAIKFQLFKAESLVTQAAKQTEYQKKNCNTEKTQYVMLKSLELSYDDFQILSEEAKSIKIDCIITPFDLDSLRFIVDRLALNIIKIASGDITFGPLLLEAARSKNKIILSTGMSTVKEIEQALEVIAFGGLHLTGIPTIKARQTAYCSQEGQDYLQEHVTLLHCVSEYPAPYEDMDLRVMDILKNHFHLKIGLSDHSQGIIVPIAAVARGACVIEKHFTLDKCLEGPDHLASLDPKELTEMIRGIRIVEQSLGEGKKNIKPSELKNKSLVRRSLVAKRAIKNKEVFTEENMGMKRPEGKKSPMEYWDFLGKKATRAYEKDEELA